MINAPHKNQASPTPRPGDGRKLPRQIHTLAMMVETRPVMVDSYSHYSDRAEVRQKEECQN